MAQTFEQWSRKVDEAIDKLCGLSSYDLPDMDYWEMYDAGTRPEIAAKRAIRNAGSY